MPSPTTPVTVRLTKDTLATLDRLFAPSPKIPKGRAQAARLLHRNRSDALRHVIRTGLDVLTGAEPIEL